jgi:hypothetical protein
MDFYRDILLMHITILKSCVLVYEHHDMEVNKTVLLTDSWECALALSFIGFRNIKLRK